MSLGRGAEGMQDSVRAGRHLRALFSPRHGETFVLATRVLWVDHAVDVRGGLAKVQLEIVGGDDAALRHWAEEVARARG